MQARLIVVEPKLQPHEYRIHLPLIIGRGGDSKLQLDHHLISRHHCELYERPRPVDGSRSCIALTAPPLSASRENAPLPSGELLTVGSITFRAFYGEDVILAEDRSLTETAAGIETLAIDETLPFRSVLPNVPAIIRTS